MEIDHNIHFRVIQQHIPRIAEGLRLFWGHAEFEGFVNGLMRDSRDGTRRGFPVPVAEALMRLARDHDRLFPQHAGELAIGPELLPTFGHTAILAPNFR